MALLLKRLWIILLLLSSGFIVSNEANAQSGKVLAWIGEGRSPQDKTAGSTGELVYINPDGTTENLLQIGANVEGVYPCSSSATSPDGRYFTFFVNTPAGGRDGGTLYQITDSGQPVEIASGHAMSCIGNGTFQYSPDSNRFAYIDYDQLPTNGEYASGTLRLFDTESRTEIRSFASVGGFYLDNNSLQFLQYYTSNQNLVDEIAVTVYQDETAVEIATLFTETECRFSTAQITPTGETLTIFVGQRCANRGTSWQLYTLNPDGTGLTLALTNPIGSPFSNNTRTNTLIAAPTSDSILFTAPDGLSSNTVTVDSIPLNNLTAAAINVLIPRGAVMPRYNPLTFTVQNNAFPERSPDGRWWATVVTDGSRRSVNVIDLSNPAAQPLITTTADDVPALLFQPDSTGLYYVSGDYEGGGNTLGKIDLTSGSIAAIATGAYGPGVISPDGTTLALIMWQDGTDSRTTRYQSLALVNPADGSVTASLFEGIVYNESNELRARRFAYPLAFRG